MPVPRLLSFLFAVAAFSAAHGADPAPAPEATGKGLNEPFPVTPETPANPAVAPADPVLPLGESAPRAGAAPQLIPDDVPKGLKPPGLPAPRTLEIPRLTVTASEVEMRIRFTKARNIAEADPKVRAAWDASRGTRPDYAKRQALRRYQNVLYSRMLSLDRSIAPLVEKQKTADKNALEQTQIQPTVPYE